MQLAAAQLEQHLQAGLRTLYVLQGDEPLLMDEALDAIRARARAAGFAERAVHTVSGANFKWDAVLASGNSLSLFSDKQIVEVRLPGGKPGKDGSAALQSIAGQSGRGEETLWLITLPRLDKATRASAWCQALETAGVCIPIQGVDRNALPQWIARRLARQGQRVQDGEAGARALQFFADQVEGNLLAAHQEISKLALLYPEGELARAQIESAVLNVTRYDVFKLSEAVLSGQLARVQRMLDGLQAEGEAAVRVHYALAEDIRALKRAKNALAQGQPMPVVLREQRIWGARERLFERALARMTEPMLTRLLHAAHQADGIVKGLQTPGWPKDPWLALQRLAFRLTSACRA
ncbi:MAG: DNA polymerase III subunit delta [Burkholderiaceae bacterium]|jgi:DNA polymerase-3 subunit delta|nr:DNA polymerase III subunit delta [Burkholderiaceae bacterium]